MKLNFPGIGAPSYFSAATEVPSPLFRPKHDPVSPGSYPSLIGYPHGFDHTARPSQPMDCQPAIVHGMDHMGITHLDRVPYHYSSERSGHGPTFDRPSSPRPWTPQPVSSGNSRCNMDVGTGLASGNGFIRSGSQGAGITSTTVEVVVPQALLGYIYGDNNSNLNHIRQISGAKVVVHDQRPGTTEGLVIVSGTPDQTRAAQSLIHAFILSGHTMP